MLGRSIGNYQVTSLLGEGGMGRVYLAHQPALARQSAIKVMHPALAGDPQAVSRFFDEARALSAIRHPHIVEVLDCGTLADGAPYIIMEYLEGETLSARLQRAAMTLVDALDIACQVASALAAAHAKNIVHRDLKPDNVFLIRTEDGDPRPRVKVLDFGVAKLQRNDDPPEKTRNGALIGTPLYMSPEQCLGEGEVDARSDIYSLGVIVYEMLCGRPPFVSPGVGAIINMHINLLPEPPRAMNPNLSAPLEAAVLRALAKDPADRFSGMPAFFEELRAALAALGGEAAMLPLHEADPEVGPLRRTPTPVPLSALTTLAMPASSPDMPVRPRRSRRRKWALTVIGVAELVAGVALATAFIRDRSAPAVAPSPPVVVVRERVAAPPPRPVPGRKPVIIESDPPGATVSAAGVVLGTTPLSWETLATGETVEMVFQLDGHRPRTVLAAPSPGLRVRATLERVAPVRKPQSVAVDAAPPPPAPAEPLDDIKSER